MKTKVKSETAETTQIEQKKKSKVQLFMEEMQKKPMIKIVDMRAVLR
jgi:Rieske Fe-S protein